MKLSAKFARQETEPERLARIARKRIGEDRIDAVRRMLGLPDEDPSPARGSRDREGLPELSLSCPQCERRFELPMHLGRHLSAAHHNRPPVV